MQLPNNSLPLNLGSKNQCKRTLVIYRLVPCGHKACETVTAQRCLATRRHYVCVTHCDLREIEKRTGAENN